MFSKHKLFAFFKNPTKLVLAFFLLAIFLLPMITTSQVIIDYLRSNKNTATSITFYPPGEALSGGCTVANNSATTDYFVPFKTATEWSAFKNNKPANININCAAGSGCSGAYCTWKDGQPQPCQQNWTCTIHNWGYNSSNCIFIWGDENLGYFEPGLCCQTMVPDGCMNDLPYCYSDGTYCSSEIDMNYCNVNQATCGYRGAYCDWYNADNLCTSILGNTACYDPNFEYCCDLQPAFDYPIVCPLGVDSLNFCYAGRYQPNTECRYSQ